MPIAGLKTHKPSGAVPWPFILLEGEEKAGKSWAIAEFTRSKRTGTLYWIDLNEGAAEEYGAIPGADYEVVELETANHHELLRAIELIKAEAQRAADAGEPPVGLAIDSGSAIWNGLKDWATERAMKQRANRELLAKDPNAEIKVTANLWNDAGSRWRKIQFHLATFPGIVVITAKGKEVVEMRDGRPVEGSKVWSVDCHKELPYAATVWLRMRRDDAPEIVGARSVHAGIKPGKDRPKRITSSDVDGRLLEWIVFDVLRCDPATAHVRDVKEYHGGELTADERAAQIEAEEAAIAEARGERPTAARGQQPGERQQGPRPAAAQQGSPRPRSQRPGVDYTLTAIRNATTAEMLDRIAAVLEEHGMLGVEHEDDAGVLSLEDRIRARREQLAEAEKQARKVAAANEATASAAREQRSEVAEADPAGQSTPVDALLAPSAEPDPAADCRNTAARRGVLASLVSLDVDGDAIAERFGRPADAVATKRLTALVRVIIAEQRVAGQESAA